MALPKVYHPIKKQDFTLRPITVHKEYVIQKSVDLYSGTTPITGSGYKLWEARYLGEKLKLSSSTYYPTNSWDGTYQNIIWNQIDAQYYRYPYDRFATLEHSNPRFTYKFLNYSASVISVPEMDFGEMIKPGSVEVTCSELAINLKDDGNGNLYDVSIYLTSSFADSKNIVAYLGFNEAFRGLKLPGSDVYWISGNKPISYTSKVFDVDKPCIAKNIKLHERYDFSAGSPCGLFGIFSSSSVMIPNRNEFNFTKNDDFTISFWIYFVDTDSTCSIITKRGTVMQQTLGPSNKINSNDMVVQDYIFSASYVDKPIDVYPYDFQLYDYTKIRFKRSDGINSVTLDLIPDNDAWNHIALVKTGSQYQFYHNGVLSTSASNYNLGHCNNDYSIMIGALNQSFRQPFSGFLDEIRFYNKGLSQSNIQTLSYIPDQSAYQTNVVGNVFYRSGKIVFGGINTEYSKIIDNEFILKFKGTHTIYQYETLVRIPKGSFNLSQNPTMLQNPYTDLIINDATGSLEDGALFPYATQVGLYNDKGEMMAVAKLSQPLQMRDDVDISILIKFDG